MAGLMRGLVAGRMAGLVAGLLGVTALHGCASKVDPDDRWPPASTSVTVDGPIWRVGTAVHLPDGTTITLDGEPAGYVVTAGGAWYLTDEGETVDLHLATPLDSDTLIEGVHPRADSMATSPDGRWLGFVDDPTGRISRGEVVIVDTLAGREVVRSSRGMGEGRDSDNDWQELYAELPVSVLGITADTAYVSGLDETVVWDLATAHATTLSPTARPDRVWVLDPPYWNASHTWSIRRSGSDGARIFRGEDGTEVATRSAARDDAPVGSPPLRKWWLEAWSSDDTAIGVTSIDGGADPQNWETPALVECVVPSGECQLVPGTEHGVSLPLDRPRLVHPQSN